MIIIIILNIIDTIILKGIISSILFNKMDFFNNIVETGFSVKCLYGDDEYQHNKGIFKIIVNENITIPDVLNELDILLIATIAVHFENDVGDIFNYDNSCNLGEFYINNTKYQFSLPLDVQSLFYMKHEETIAVSEEDETFVDFSNTQIELFNKILGHIKDLQNGSYFYEDKFFKFKTAHVQTNDLVVIRNNKRITIGIGKIFKQYKYYPRM